MVLIWFHSQEFIPQKRVYRVSFSSASMQSRQGNPGQPLMSTATLQRERGRKIHLQLPQQTFIE